MKNRWLKKSGAAKLLIFFNGYGQSETVLSGFETAGFDVLIVQDYREMVWEVPPEVYGYAETVLLAWSLGVYAAAAVKPAGLNLKAAAAVNGTLNPVSGEFGIAPEIFKGTIEHWEDERARRKFNLRMAGSADNLANLPVSGRGFMEQKAELESLYQYISTHDVPKNIYDRAIIGLDDRIFPPENQLAFWTVNQVKIEKQKMPHFPFFNLQSLADAGF